MGNVAYGWRVLTAAKRDFRSSPNNGHLPTDTVGPFRAMNRHRRCDVAATKKPPEGGF